MHLEPVALLNGRGATTAQNAGQDLGQCDLIALSSGLFPTVLALLDVGCYATARVALSQW